MDYQMLIAYLECIRALPQGEAYAMARPVSDRDVAGRDDSGEYFTAIVRLAADVSVRLA